MIDIIAASKSIVDLTKQGMDIAKRMDDLELKEVILNLKEKVLLIQDENVLLKEKVNNLEAEKSLSDTLFFDNNMYWKKSDSEQKQGPFCSPCWDTNKKLVNMHQQANGFRCPTCNKYVSTSSGEVTRVNSGRSTRRGMVGW